MSFDYYAAKLSGERLERCYELAPPRVQQHLEAEIAHAVSLVPRGALVLELGCGYGRVLERIASVAGMVCGIDISIDSLRLALRRLKSAPHVVFGGMDASKIGFAPASFECVLCLQNGISSFHVDQRFLMEAAVDVTRPGGRVLFSTYAEEFWEHRLEWFRVQSSHGLIGEIDESATRSGVIVCKDGFTATTVTPEQFSSLARGLGREAEIETIDHSCVFCEVTV